jgi:hypothetical protein
LPPILQLAAVRSPGRWQQLPHSSYQWRILNRRSGLAIEVQHTQRLLSVQVMQSRSRRTLFNAYYTQRHASPPSYLTLLHFLRWVRPSPILRTFSLSWFCKTSACCLRNSVTKLQHNGIQKKKLQFVLHREHIPICIINIARLMLFMEVTGT